MLLFSCSVLSDSFVTPWIVAHQAPLSTGFCRQEYWSGLPSPPPGDLPNPGIKPRSPTLQADSLLSEPPWKLLKYTSTNFNLRLTKHLNKIKTIKEYITKDFQHSRFKAQCKMTFMLCTSALRHNTWDTTWPHAHPTIAQCPRGRFCSSSYPEQTQPQHQDGGQTCCWRSKTVLIRLLTKCIRFKC